MEKTAATDVSLTESVYRRWSPIIFSEAHVSKDHLKQIMVAASWASSCFNAQPWSFIFGTHENHVTFSKLKDCLSPLNKEWAANAPVLMFALA